ncbi:MAG: CXXX repeat peptide modification system protein [Tannerella sp.]|jgi:CXXX repeat modification system protein|nr:CXXX repeat peptide modification system protein [Tannerella sp.]
MKKEIGRVSSEEKNEILALYERRNGLNELVKIIGNDEALYEKIVVDLGSTSVKFQSWWDRMASKYKWESTENGHWEIDFDTYTIYLIE